MQLKWSFQELSNTVYVENFWEETTGLSKYEYVPFMYRNAE